MSVKEIEQAITELEPAEIVELTDWLNRYHSASVGTPNGTASADPDLGPERTDAELAAGYRAWVAANPHNPENFDNSPLPILRDGGDW